VRSTLELLNESVLLKPWERQRFFVTLKEPMTGGDPYYGETNFPKTFPCEDLTGPKFVSLFFLLDETNMLGETNLIGPLVELL
jgi:hypothetical protein